jgi:hypothetical protein
VHDLLLYHLALDIIDNGGQNHAADLQNRPLRLSNPANEIGALRRADTTRFLPVSFVTDKLASLLIGLDRSALTTETINVREVGK